MKLASLRDGTRDGRLVVVSHDLTRASDARHIAPTLQAALDDWDRVAPQLELIARSLESGGQPVERFHERDARSPLSCRPDGAAFLDPRAPLPLRDEGVALAPGVALVTGPGSAGIRLVLLASGPEAAEACAFAPVAVTPDEFGPGVDLRVSLNGGAAAPSVRQDLAALAATAASFASRLVGPAASPHGALALRLGDTIRIEARDPNGHSIFGAIEQTVAPAAA